VIDLIAIGLVIVVWLIGQAFGGVWTERARVKRPTLDPTAKLLNRTQIRAQFNWSDTMIEKYLGKPDEIRIFKRRYGRTGEEHLFFRDRVEAAMLSPGFEPKRVQTRRPKEPVMSMHIDPPSDSKIIAPTADEVAQVMRMSIEGQKLRKLPRKRK
jgi:hypothetical protein